MTNLLQLLLGGIAQGCVYGLIALGIVLIYKATEVVNFAQGELTMVGGFATYTAFVLWGWPYLLAVPFAMVVAALFGAFLERVALRPVEGESAISIIMITLGLGLIARGIVVMIPEWGADTHRLAAPYAGLTWTVGGVVVSVDHLVVVVATAILCAALYFFFRYNRFGLAMQAASQNQLAASYIGIPVSGTTQWIWALSAAVAALAGALLAPLTFVHVNMGYVGLKAFPAAVIGGLTSIPGAVVGGLVLGLSETLAGYYLPQGFKQVTAYVLVLAVLFLRPSGIFADALAKKV